MNEELMYRLSVASTVLGAVLVALAGAAWMAIP